MRRETHNPIKLPLLWLLPLAGLLCGCQTVRQSEPARTATEQLLISTASDHALMGVDFSWAAGEKIFVDDKYFESYDKGYVIGLIRERLSQSGALLMRTDATAEIIVEIRCGGLSINNAETLVGFPAMTIPIPLSGPAQTPELAFYKSDRDDSLGKFALFAYARDSGEPLCATGPLSGNAHYHFFKAMGFRWLRTDIPELQRHKKSPH